MTGNKETRGRGRAAKAWRRQERNLDHRIHAEDFSFGFLCPWCRNCGFGLAISCVLGFFGDPQNEEKAGLENDLRLRSRYICNTRTRERERDDGNQYQENLVTLHFLSSFFLWNNLLVTSNVNLFFFLFLLLAYSDDLKGNLVVLVLCSSSSFLFPLCLYVVMTHHLVKDKFFSSSCSYFSS